MYTGNANQYSLNHNMQPVYPCVYRERLGLDAGDVVNAGLSLCIQGTLIKVFTNTILGRFIPVYTGNAGKIQN